METFVKEFHKAEFEGKAEAIIEQLSDKDCQRVEFLRGMLAAFRQIMDSKGWVAKNANIFFD
ncbi:MAG TPA: hypothetical protein DDW27_08515 [Bacteroidales bacterium]|nr:hypothetical protein [Bacteroidales bacterium]